MKRSRRFLRYRVTRPIYDPQLDEVNRLLYMGPFVFGLFSTRRGHFQEKHLGGEITFYPPFEGGRYRTWVLQRKPRYGPRLHPYLRLVVSRSMLSCNFGIELHARRE